MQKYFTISPIHLTYFFSMNTHFKTRRGFTLTELLVVIAIIGLLSGIVLVNVNLARNKGKNARSASDISQYLTGLALARERAADHKYPSIRGWVCLGESANCKWDGSSPNFNGGVNSKLKEVMSSLPSSTFEESNYKGYLYTSNGKIFTLRWFLYGKGRKCDPGERINDIENITLCKYERK